jgi:hypothetical protein
MTRKCELHILIVTSLLFVVTLRVFLILCYIARVVTLVVCVLFGKGWKYFKFTLQDWKIHGSDGLFLWIFHRLLCGCCVFHVKKLHVLPTECRWMFLALRLYVS